MKLRVALFEPNIYELKKIQAFLQTTSLNIDLFRASSVESAIKILNEHDHFHLIVMNSRMSPYKKINEHFQQTVLSRFSEQKYMLLHSKPEYKGNSELLKFMIEQLDYDPWLALPLKPLKFYNKLETMFYNLSSFFDSSKQVKYVALNKRELQQVKTTPIDIYIQLSSEKFVKVVNAGEHLDGEFYEKYYKKGITRFFVDRDEFSNSFEQFFPPTLINKEAFASREEYAIEAGGALNEMISEFGISEEVVEIATELADEVYTILESNNLEMIVDRLKASSDTFIYDHSFLTSLICLETSKKFRWYSSKYNRMICMASLLHDADIKDSKFFALEINPELLDVLSKEEVQQYVKHPENIASQLNKVKDIPSDVLGMILRHHEGFGKPKSFPNGFFSTQLSALECLFVMSHEVVVLFYQQLFHPDKIEKKLPYLWEELTKGSFRKYVDELKKTVENMVLNMKGEA